MAAFMVVCLLALVAFCNAAVPSFSAGRQVGTVKSSAIGDCSGMAASRKYDEIIYVLNDHGGVGPKVFALNASDASLIATFTISPVNDNDWEDMAVGPCGADSPGNTCIYISDTGLYHGHDENTIYKIAEPRTMQDQTLTPMTQLKFTWDDPESDTIMVDPNGEVFIISKVLGGRGMIAHIPSSAWGQSSPVGISSSAFLYTPTEHHDPVAGDISPNGEEVIVKTKEDIFYWQVLDGDYIAALTGKGTKVPYHMESLGEAACWSADGTKYYTLGEGHYQPLYVYERATGP